MEAYMKLKRSWHQFRSASDAERFYDVDFSGDEKDVFRCHLNEIDHVHLLDSYEEYQEDNSQHHKHIDPRTEQVITNFVINSVTNNSCTLFENFPKTSALPKWKHEACIRALNRMNNKNAQSIAMNDTAKNDLQTYMGTWNDRQKERTQFLEFVQNYFYTNLVGRCKSLSPLLEEYVVSKWRSSIDSVKANDTMNYILQTAIPLEFPEEGNNVQLEVDNPIEQFGCVYQYFKCARDTCLQTKLNLTKSYDKSSTSNAFPCPEEIARRHNAQFVISKSALRQFLYANSNEPWSIPFRILQYADMNDRKICYFDKPLPKMYLSAAERNRKAFKHRLIESSVSPVNDSARYYLRSHSFEKLTSNSDHESTTFELENNKTETAYRLTEFNDYLQKNEAKLKTSKIGKNLAYSLSSLKNQQTNEVIQMLVQTKQDFCEKISKDGEEDSLLVNLSSKIEFQSEFGAEQMSINELINEWCTNRFRPDSVTDRIRIDAKTGCVLTTTRLTIDRIEADLNRLHKIKATSLITKLWGILNVIKNFPPNDYLLQHNQKHGTKAMVFVKCDSSSATAINMTKLYDDKINIDKSLLEVINWNPIDDMEVMPIHLATSVMPCAFPFKENSRTITAKKKKPIGKTNINDRSHIVIRANRKTAMKQKVKQKIEEKRKEITKIKRNSKRSRKVQQKRLAKRKEQRLNSNVETIDPNLVFDDRGNITISGLMLSSTTTVAEKTNFRSPSKTAEFNYKEYVLEANGEELNN